MIGHIGINVPDLVVARAYYDEVMPMFGFETFLDDADQQAWRPAGGKPGTYLFLYRAADQRAYSHEATGLQHLAFIVPDRRTVRDVHRRALALGSREIHEPQAFPQYPPPYFAAFWSDPFGITIEAVCHHDR